MSMLKRWWWVGAVIVVAAVAAFMLLGRGGGPAVPTPGQQGSGTTTQTPGSSPTSGSVATSSQPGVAPSAPVKPASKGTKLATVTVPPTQTLARVAYSADRDGQTYNASFRPFGTGPSRGGHGSVVASISSWKPRKTYANPLRLPSDNVLLELGPGVSVNVGGSYTGVVKLTKSSGALVLVLTSVKAR